MPNATKPRNKCKKPTKQRIARYLHPRIVWTRHVPSPYRNRSLSLRRLPLLLQKTQYLKIWILRAKADRKKNQANQALGS